MLRHGICIRQARQHALGAHGRPLSDRATGTKDIMSQTPKGKSVHHVV